MNVSEIAKLAEQGKQQFEKAVLEGPEFKRLIHDIEENALVGKTGFRKTLKTDDEIRMYEVFVIALNQAGYKSFIRPNKSYTVLNPSHSETMFSVSWKTDEQK